MAVAASATNTKIARKLPAPPVRCGAPEVGLGDGLMLVAVPARVTEISAGCVARAGDAPIDNDAEIVRMITAALICRFSPASGSVPDK
jgi:hypothetical protein